MRSFFLILLVCFLVVARASQNDPEKNEADEFGNDSNEDCDNEGRNQEDRGEGYPSSTDYGDDTSEDYDYENRRNYKNAPPKADDTHPEYPEEEEKPQNKVEFTIFVALRPNSQSVGHALTKVLNPFLNLMDLWFLKKYQFLYYEEQPRPLIFRRPEVDLWLVPNVEPDRLFYDEDNRWTWWKYEFTYNCFESGTDSPTNPATTEETQEDVEDYLEAVMQLEDLRQDIMGLVGFKVFQVQMEEPTTAPPKTPPGGEKTSPPAYSTFAPSTTPSQREWRGDPTTERPTNGNPTSSTPPSRENTSSESTSAPSLNPSVATMQTQTTLPPTSLEDDGPLTGASPDIVEQKNNTLGIKSPLDVTSDWGWRRSVGVGLLLGTVLGTICLSQLAALRRHRRGKQEKWSNLATEEGVDELLRTSWKVKGTRIEIFENVNRGQYRDDDSMLVGGFQSPGIAVGAEITIKPSEETLPETAFNSSFTSHESP